LGQRCTIGTTQHVSTAPNQNVDVPSRGMAQRILDPDSITAVNPIYDRTAGRSPGLARERSPPLGGSAYNNRAPPFGQDKGQTVSTGHRKTTGIPTAPPRPPPSSGRSDQLRTDELTTPTVNSTTRSTASGTIQEIPIASITPDIRQSNVLGVPRYLGNHTPVEHIPKTPTIGPTFNPPKSGITQTNPGAFTHVRGGPAYLQGDVFSHRSPHLGSNTERTASPFEQVAGASAHMDIDHPPPSPGQSSQFRTNESPLSPTTPTPTGGRRQRQRPSQSDTYGKEIPQMLGNVRDIMSNLATSIEGLKDAIYDLRTQQNTPGGSGSVPAHSSRKGKERARRDGGGGDSGGRPQSGTGGGSRAQNAGGHLGDEYIADDEGQEDEVEEPIGKDYKLRVSSIT
jgi:hypothetical protein